METPEFAIFQNSRTKQSAVWNGQKWAEPPVKDYDHLRLLATLIRTDPDPVGIVKELIRATESNNGENESIT
jgi:hypothetical protein